MRQLLLILLSVILAGCTGKAGEKLYRRSFSMFFYETKGIEVELYGEKMWIFINQGDLTASYMSTEAAHINLYDNLCQKYGDMNYNRKEFVSYGFQPSFQAYSFVSLDIVSDSDFDATHPAGTSLADIVIYDGQSSKPFVDSGYTLCYWEDMDKFYYEDKVHERPYYPVYKKASEVTAYDMMMIYEMWTGPNMYLNFDAPPTASKNHNITVTFTDERGRVFSDTIRMTFE